MKGIRRKEKEIQEKAEIEAILKQSKYITLAMCSQNEPYLVTLSHGYDTNQNCIYFHCAQDGKKIDILKQNDTVWGQALIDHGYVQGKCDHLYSTVQFHGKVSFISEIEEKRNALLVMIKQLENKPDEVIQEQINESSLKRVNIGRIDIGFMSGKKSKEVIISL
ncbi:MAG: pyridoxamine 5'-phosphate oxidase family protein [Candidatus Thorarchaeota archaeon]